MTGAAWATWATAFCVLLGLAWPLGGYMARVYAGQARWAERIVGPIERAVYRLARIAPQEDMSYAGYVAALLVFNGVGAVGLYALQRVQALLPGNPVKLSGVEPAIAFNTAVSFVTNTNWQAYGGETTMSFTTQVVGLTVQNYLSAATGLAVMVAFVRGLSRKHATGIGNFWVDLTRSTLYVLLPLSCLLAVVLVGQGVVQTWSGSAVAQLLDPVHASGREWTEQTIALGPVASQEAIKQLGTNGGGFFNVNAAHPFENPTPLSNFIEWLSILLIPVASCFALGALVGDKRQGYALLAAMLAVFVPAVLITTSCEQAPQPELVALGVDQWPSALSSGGNMEGKEVRLGITDSALWAAATTATSNGSVNSMHDSYAPLGGMVLLILMQLGEIIFGGVGSGLYGMLIYVILTVFIAGLMVGRTPEYLGKKIEAFEIKMAALVLLVPAALVLAGTALAAIIPAGSASLGNPGAHGFSEILYAFSSAANNNGSAFAGLGASGLFYALGLGLCMLIGRYFIIVFVLAIAGSLARKGRVPTGPGTLGTHGPLFVALLVGTILIGGALAFVPALALGPIAEHFQLFAH